MKKDLKIKILELIEEKNFKEAKNLAEKDKTLKEFYDEQLFFNETFGTLRIRKVPENLNKKIMERLFSEEKAEKEPFLNSIFELFAFPRLSFSIAFSIILILTGFLFYSVKPLSTNFSYYTYKAKSKLEFYLEKIDSAKDLFVFMFDTKKEEVIKDLINKENKKNKEDKKWEIKTERNPRQQPYFFHSFQV